MEMIVNMQMLLCLVVIVLLVVPVELMSMKINNEKPDYLQRVRKHSSPDCFFFFLSCILGLGWCWLGEAFDL